MRLREVIGAIFWLSLCAAVAGAFLICYGIFYLVGKVIP